jgi:dephospho-CoA kinase
MKTVIITGGIGSGKSSVCKYLASKGVPVYDCDARAKELYDQSPIILKSLEKTLGRDLRGADGKLDRKLLASIIFNDDKALEMVDSIVHPAVIEDFNRWKETFADAPFVVMESALAFGNKRILSLGDKVLLVTAPLATRLQRAMDRDNAAESAVMSRINAQDRKYFGRDNKADAEIVNDGKLDELYHKVDLVFARLWN